MGDELWMSRGTEVRRGTQRTAVGVETSGEGQIEHCKAGEL